MLLNKPKVIENSTYHFKFAACFQVLFDKIFKILHIYSNTDVFGAKRSVIKSEYGII